jgi:hypothetical protein
MSPSPPVLPQASILSLHFPQFRIGVAECLGGSPGGNRLLLFM